MRTFAACRRRGSTGRRRAGAVSRAGGAAVAVALALTAASCTSVRADPVRTERTEPAAPSGPCPWRGSTRPVAERVRAVLERMTLAEKISMVHGAEAAPGDAYPATLSGIPRLCIPTLHLADGPAGLGDLMTGVTQLPAPVALAATWDEDLSRSYGATIGSEARAKGVGIVLGPMVNIVRDPRWGRAYESLGEDPHLTARIGAADVTGIQSAGVIAEVKHFAAYNQETYRNTSANVVVDERTLREIYLPAFEAAVRDAHAGSVMCAYSTVDGAPACANDYLLTDILKREWQFDGFVASDWFADVPEVEAAQTGLDVQMPDDCRFGQQLTDAIATGRMSLLRLDDMVGRILTTMFRAGLVDRPPSGRITAAVATPGAAGVGRAVAAEGSVLLRNAGVLPLEATTVHSIAVIGTGSLQPISAGDGSAHVVASQVRTPLDAITARAGTAMRVVSDAGTVPARAALVAASVDVPIVFAGRGDGEYHDHTTLDLAPADTALIEAVAAANPRTVVVLATGSSVVMPWLTRVAGVLESWYPGQDGAAAIAALLFGDVNPSGKLPVTFPRSLADVPAATAVQWPGSGVIRYSEGLRVGYRAYDARGIAPAFPFGFGLSYTEFAFGPLQIRQATSTRAIVDVSVRNTGARAGSDVVQLYVGDPPTTGEPPHRLGAFSRVSLEPGQSKRVELNLDIRALSHWDATRRAWVASRGRYDILVGDSSAELPSRDTLDLRRDIVTAPAPPPLPAPAGPATPSGRCETRAGSVKSVGDESTPVRP